MARGSVSDLRVNFIVMLAASFHLFTSSRESNQGWTDLACISALRGKNLSVEARVLMKHTSMISP